MNTNDKNKPEFSREQDSYSSVNEEIFEKKKAAKAAESKADIPKSAPQSVPANGKPAEIKPSEAKPAPDKPKMTKKDILDTIDNTRITSASQKAKQAEAKRQEKLRKNPPKERKTDHVANTMLSAVKAVSYILIVIIVSVALAISIIMVGNDVFAFVKSDELVKLNIPEYATIDDISSILAENGVIKYPAVFKIYADIKEDDGKFVSGEYTVSPSMDYEDLLAAFKEKKQTGTVTITIPEGYTVDEIIDLMVSKGIGEKDEYIDIINNYEFNYWFVKELEENGIPEGRYYRLEGYLFPDTYEFYVNSSEYTVINKLLYRFKQMYSTKMRESATTLGYTTDEVVMLASMIEKESKYTIDRANIASVFTNRLRNPAGYPYLQSDATIMYAIHHLTGERKQFLTNEDLVMDTPYNSYTNQGLPPGPISNPGYSSLMYALSPADTKYYYFLTDKSGYAHFAATLEEHNQNIRDYLTNSDNEG